MSLSKLRSPFCIGATLVVGAVALSSFPLPESIRADGANPTRSPVASAAAPASHAEVVERGKYLVTILDCHGCHTPWTMTDKGPAPDMSRMLSGHPSDLKMPPPPAAQGPWLWQGAATNTAFAGPWGVTYTVNLTPDVNTGLGIWTEEMFIKALRTGKHFGQSRPIQPPMPWPAYGQMTDADLKAVYAYLRTIPPVKNLVPDYEPPVK